MPKNTRIYNKIRRSNLNNIINIITDIIFLILIFNINYQYKMANHYIYIGSIGEA